MHRFNRIYLLASIVVSFIIPIIPIEITKVSKIQEIALSSVSQTIPNTLTKGTSIQTENFNWELYLMIIYLLITSIVFIRFIRNLQSIYRKIKDNTQITYQGETLILMPEKTIPFSFLNYIFVSKNQFESGTFHEAVFIHERTHVKEKHSWDILFIEILLIFLWFHPGLYLTKKALKLTHEFIADSAVLRNTPLLLYQNLLLSFSSIRSIPLTSSLNESSILKRIKIMKKRTSTFTKWSKVLPLLPLFALLVYSLSYKVEAQAYTKSQLKKHDYIKTQSNYDLSISISAEGMIQNNNTKYSIEEFQKVIKLRKLKESFTTQITVNPETAMKHLADIKTMLRDHGATKIDIITYKKSIGMESKNETQKTDTEKRGTHVIKGKTFFYITKNNLTQYYDTYGNPVTNEGLPIPTVIQFPSDFPDKIGC